MSGVLNLSDDLRNIIVFLSIEVFVSTLYPSSPYKSNLINLSSERFAIEPIILVLIRDMSVTAGDLEILDKQTV